MGTVPLSYFGGNEKLRSLTLYVNARQILEQLRQKEHLKRQSTNIFFSPFAKLRESDKILGEIESLIENDFHVKSQKLCLELIELSLNGLKYYQTYDWTFLMVTVVIGYVSWIVYALVYVLRQYTKLGRSFYKTTPTIFHLIVSNC